MKKLLMLLATMLMSISVVGMNHEGKAEPSSKGASPKQGTRVITLGTRAGPSPTTLRAQTSNLLVVNGVQYLIDAGDGVTRRLARLGTNFRSIDNIFITHPHSDHTGGLGALMGVMFDVFRTKEVNIYGPPGTAATVQGLLQFLAVSSEIRISEGTRTVPIAKIFRGHDKDVGTIFQDANVKVTAVENTHFNFPPGSSAYGKYKSYSLRFDTPDRSVVFTGDPGPSDAVVALAKDADLLLSEVVSIDDFMARQKETGRWQSMTPAEQANTIRHQKEEHLIPEEVGKLAARANVKTVVLTHIAASTNPNDDYARYAEQVKKYFSGQVLVAKDLMEF